MDWFTNYGAYQTLLHCLGGDVGWIAALVVFSFTNCIGYLMIAAHWRGLAATISDHDLKKDVSRLMFIFAFCGLTYLWVIVDLVWPGWRAYILFVLLPLNFFTWRFYGGASAFQGLRDSSNRHEARSKQLAELESQLAELQSMRNRRGH